MENGSCVKIAKCQPERQLIVRQSNGATAEKRGRLSAPFLRGILAAMKTVHAVASLLLAFAPVFSARAAEEIPPEPKRHVIDASGTVCHSCIERENRRLEKFGKITGNRIVVAVFSRAKTDAPADDYAARVFDSWTVGGMKNGIALLLFVDTKRLHARVGDDLKKAVPAALLARIEQDLQPFFETKKVGEGLGVGLTEIMRAIAPEAAMKVTPSEWTEPTRKKKLQP